jgi:iron complex transport system substrate-binding protein
MKRFGVILSVFTILVSLIGGCKPSFQPGTYTDDLSRPVTINVTPVRIASYGPSITEILFALGLEDKVVGVDNYSDYPEAAKSKTKLGDAFTPSIEKLVELKPDLVLTVKQQQFNTNLDNLGIKYMVIDPKDIDGIYKDIELIGKITDSAGKAKILVDNMRAASANVQSSVRNAAKVKVIFLADTTDLNNPWTGGHGSFIDALINSAGGINIAANTSAPWVQFSLEQIVSADPDVVILPDQYAVSPQTLKENSVWQKTSAAKNNRVMTINNDIISRPGPRIIQGLEAVARILHPELFK